MIVALIPAAGQGTRLGGALPKQYQLLGGRPLVGYAVEAFARVAAVTSIYVVVAPGDAQFASVPLSDQARRALCVLPVGGPTRHASVLNGLDAIAPALGERDWVLVHDAARPGLSAQMIAELVRALADDPVGGLLALPVADTLKAERVEAGHVRVARAVERAGLWQAQTPQMFRFGLLRAALARAAAAGTPVTDESSAIEQMGLAPRLVNGSQTNFKVTYPEDVLLAERLLEKD